jgi:hypothetical protein
MKFSREASYNNPHEMFPSASRLFSGMNLLAENVTSAPKSPAAVSRKESMVQTEHIRLTTLQEDLSECSSRKGQSGFQPRNQFSPSVLLSPIDSAVEIQG